ncbi:nitroreductase family protein [Anaerosporobacter sp.]|uniref:nitroreductase family protein n=1 Tax=Anaerosporobacter sp. TaxID=1872529 RepID=UPI00286F71E4|nr:nitroreductase family protein [Anaerosporobacter sp.]
MYKDFLELAESRYSVRQYSDKPIEQEKMKRILRAAQVAPTAANKQPQRIFVLQSDEALAKVKAITPYSFHAPTVLLICSDSRESWKAKDGHNSGPIDAAIAITHMMLEAFDEGIGSCWVRGFDKNVLAETFELPDYLEPVALLPIGYPAENSKPYPGAHDNRLPIEETVTYL